MKPVAALRATGSRLGAPLLRVSATAAVLVLVAHHLGAAPFRHGLSALGLPALGVAAALTLVTTLCAAWRWSVVARGLGISLRRSTAVGAYYRSQFLNSVLPGGVVGDVHRAIAHGRRTSELGTAARAVAWERMAGQVVQSAVTGVVLLTIPSPVPRVVVAAALVMIACVLGGAVRRATQPGAGLLSALRADLRRLSAVAPSVVGASLVVVAGHTAVFVVAARVAGCTAPLGQVLALAMLVQTAMVIPLSVGGWGPREGVAAWAFGSAGLGAATGVAVTTTYAVMALAAVAPGALLLLIGGRAARSAARSRCPADEVELMGDVDQLAASELPAAIREP